MVRLVHLTETPDSNWMIVGHKYHFLEILLKVKLNTNSDEGKQQIDWTASVQATYSSILLNLWWVNHLSCKTSKIFLHKKEPNSIRTLLTLFKAFDSSPMDRPVPVRIFNFYELKGLIILLMKNRLSCSHFESYNF